MTIVHRLFPCMLNDSSISFSYFLLKGKPSINLRVLSIFEGHNFQKQFSSTRISFSV